MQRRPDCPNPGNETRSRGIRIFRILQPIPDYLSIMAVPKNSGLWKSGFSVWIGAQLRKCG